ncbi:ribosome production factor 2 [Cryptosporidium andersoni]|uniref:Ribosome production factor 2 n=1 Tax=Cryptosporidium andersoni TaxID=117008 RepID=A0A1J4MNZ9_9CRYT|nr:ribosome production factor 2 [Cryptosporidium andersoni]
MDDYSKIENIKDSGNINYKKGFETKTKGIINNQQYNINDIKNKVRRLNVKKQRIIKKKLAKSTKRRENHKKETNGEIIEKGIPRTIENTREIDETYLKDAINDQELHKEMENDEFSDYFLKKRSPHLLITTCRKPSKHMYNFLKEFVAIIPNCDFYKRYNFKIKSIIKEINSNKDNTYTDLLIFIEHPIKKQPWGLYICHLPDGPTSYFRMRSLKLAQDMKGTAVSTTHNPEIILNNFDTRIGYRIGRQLASLFPFNPDFNGRRVITFHNQRDFIFFRHYRYIFKQKDNKVTSTGLQEIGPRFTLKLMWLQEGTFNTKQGNFEYIWRPDLQVNRKIFFI